MNNDNVVRFPVEKTRASNVSELKKRSVKSESVCGDPIKRYRDKFHSLRCNVSKIVSQHVDFNFLDMICNEELVAMDPVTFFSFESKQDLIEMLHKVPFEQLAKMSVLNRNNRTINQFVRDLGLS